MKDFEEGNIVDCPQKNYFGKEILAVFNKDGIDVAELDIGWDSEHGYSISEIIPLNELEISNEPKMKI